MTIEIINQQRIKRINLKDLKTCLRKVFHLLNISSKKISILLCDNNTIKKLHKRYFKKHYPTDVISFPLSDRFDPDYLGEVIVSVQKASEVAGKLNIKWKDELMLYIIHGILHLIGYKDRTKKQKELMRAKEEEILTKLKLKT